MRKVKFFLLVFSVLICIVGCKKNDEINFSDVINNTSITKKGVSSYRVKVLINGDDFSQNYIVLNKKNKEYEITNLNNNLTYVIKNGSKPRIKLESYSKIDTITDDEKKEELLYDYTNTDLFLEGLNNDSSIISEDYNVNGEVYKKINFSVSKDVMNKVLKPFSLKVNEDGNATAIIDNKYRLYIIDYDFSNIDVSVSYTNFNDIK